MISLLPGASQNFAVRSLPRLHYFHPAVSSPFPPVSTVVTDQLASVLLVECADGHKTPAFASPVRVPRATATFRVSVTFTVVERTFFDLPDSSRTDQTRVRRRPEGIGTRVFP